MKSIHVALAVACLGMLPVVGAQAATPDAFPTKAPSDSCPWVTSKAPIPQRVDQLLGRMTLAQKLHELHGVGEGKYVGIVSAIPSLCIPSLTMQDGPAGVGDGMTGVTQLPAPVALAATWSPTLARKYGAVVGAEQWGKGVKVDLGPTVNIVRDPRWGRAFESYGEDPWLNGHIASAYIKGVQGQGVMAQIKHLAMYNQETNRNTPKDDVLVSRRAMQELYLPAFETAIKNAHPASVMCSYSRINGVFACQNAYTLTQVLRDQFGYHGFVVSDWGATHATVASAKAGLNIEMPGDKYYGAPLTQAVKSGAVSVSRINELVRPILAKMFRFHLFTRTPTGTPQSTVTTPAHVAVAKKVAEQGAVLLKNADHILPLSAAKVHSIAVIGADAGSAAMTAGGGSAHVMAASIVTPYHGIQSRAGKQVRVRYAQGDTLVSKPPLVPAKYLTPTTGGGHGLTATLYANTTLSGTPTGSRNVRQLHFSLDGAPPARGMPVNDWSGEATATLDPPATGTYTFSLTSDDGSRLFVDGKEIINNWGPHASLTKTGTVHLVAGHPVRIEVDYFQASGEASLRLGWRVPGYAAAGQKARLEKAVHLAASSDVAVVFAGKMESEGSDLTNIDLPGNQNQLIAAVAAVNPDTIVVLNTGSAVTMPWLDKVKGVIEAWYPGQDDGSAIAAVLFGDVDPSGKLPVTFPKSLADVPASTKAQWPGVGGKVHYSEGLDVGYRWYDAKGIEPLFPFGYGLSYTTFAFSHLQVSPRTITPSGTLHASVEITNTGHRAGADVVQLYVGDPARTGEPPKQLKGFRKVALKPGQTRRVSFEVPAHAFATWSKQTHGWQVADGVYRIMLGDSSAHLPEHATVHVAHGHGSQR